MEAMIARVRNDERALFRAEWAHRMSCMAMGGETPEAMGETGQKEKRKPEQQGGPDDRVEDLTKIPMTPTGNPAEAAEAEVAAAAAAAAAADAAKEQETVLKPVANAKATGRVAPY